ncbi:hypothetical protein [Corynebacterium sp.]|uniref:hypothetical protein n=1 Tax=Corynebacterium sp. TaxID=1720 RepID=UPI0026DB4AC3|nr:hypothetical protein [Corynebacterium sp.]MDO5032562.1 hypothetical protein [Corynebacterium sp.]
MSEWNSEVFDVDAYLDAIGVERAAPSAQFLAQLHAGHVRTFPFTSVNLLVGEHPGVDADTVFGHSIRTPLPLHEGAQLNQGGRIFSLHVHDRYIELWRDGKLQHIIDDLPVAPVDVDTAHTFLQEGFGPFSSTLMAQKHSDGAHITVTADKLEVPRYQQRYLGTLML